MSVIRKEVEHCDIRSPYDSIELAMRSFVHVLLALLLLLQGTWAASGIPALSLQDSTVRPDVPIKVLGWLEALHEVSAKCGFTNLPRAGYQHHFSVQICCNEVIQITFHSDYFNQ